MKTKKTKFHLLVYSENCSIKLKKFSTIKAMDKFIEDFLHEHPDYAVGDNWIDYKVTNVTGEVTIYDSSVSLAE